MNTKLEELEFELEMELKFNGETHRAFNLELAIADIKYKMEG